ncbi:MAG: ATP-grasp domain-containing protein [Bdellovibrionales bacterium]|nr:ATP-grasp domain-containing protein [Bdellovibrionales bacterium]
MIGILGSGQLAKMISEAAQGMGIPVTVLAASQSDPAVHSAAESQIGSWENPSDLTRFIAGKDRVLFENEFVPEKAFRTAGIASDDPLFEPRLSILYRLQDKWQQKLILNELQIPTSDAQLIRGQDLQALQDLDHRYGKGGWVLKWCRLGYDGKGTFLKSLDHSAALKFLEAADTRGVSIYAEAKVAFVRELAMVYARNHDGDFLHFPLVISEQRDGICFEVKGPASAFGVSLDLEKRAADYGRRLGDRLGLTGVYAIEFFEAPAVSDLKSTRDARGLWVNEIAPRVHNSGHYSQDACSFSQFQAHLAMALSQWKGERVLAPQAKPFFGMLNLIGETSGKSQAPKLPKDSKLILHWYQKTEIRPGRKMGHLNYFADSIEEFEKLAKSARDVKL